MASLDWSECPALESIPGKVIMEWSDGLDRDQVRAVIEFAARSLERAPALTP